MDHDLESINTRDMNALTLSEFAEHLLSGDEIRRLIELAFDEDLGAQAKDWTGVLMFSEDDTRHIVMRARERGIVAGLAFVNIIMQVFDPDQLVEWEIKAQDGQWMEEGDVLVSFKGNARAIVALERTVLNLISRLSGIATRTRMFVDLAAKSQSDDPVAICDTRKTTVGHRLIEKYAVRCGGGVTHRLGLYDAVLIKDNHLAGIPGDSISDKLNELRKEMSAKTNLWFIQVEVDSLEQFERVLETPAGTVDMVLLDNMSSDTLTQAVSMRDHANSTIVLEASGGVNERTVSKIAQSGVDRISIGGLTHQATSLDIGFDSV